MTRVELKNMAKEQIQGKIGILFLIFLIIREMVYSMYQYLYV